MPTDTVGIIMPIVTITPITPVPGVIGFPGRLTGGAVVTPAALGVMAGALRAAAVCPPMICN